MEWSICGIGVVSMGKCYWVFVIFLPGFVIDLLLLLLLRLDLWFVQRLFSLSGYVHFFIDFSCYLIVGFLGSICKILGEGAKYINFRAKIKIIFVNIYIYIYIYFFFSNVGGGWPPQPLNSSVTEYDQSYIYIYIYHTKAVALIQQPTKKKKF